MKRIYYSLSFLLFILSSTVAQVMMRDQFPNLSFTLPVGLYHSEDGSNRLFVVEQGGLIKVFQNDSTAATSKIFLDLQDSVVSGGELGLLGLAFHPHYAQNGYFYVDYTRDNPLQTVIARYKISPTNPDSADPSSAVTLIIQNQPFTNHNGGQLAFGPDGYLYIAFGDGGSGGDPYYNGQSDTTLLGKILRINVDSSFGGKNYTIPPDNPFYGSVTGQKQEIFAYGFRNPWRFSFDHTTLWVADVGQNLWEEIDTVINGKNYGWNIMEGMHCFDPSTGCNQTGLTLPIWEYYHDTGKCSITGGFVYRGPSIPALAGRYIYADYCTGEIWALTLHGVSPATSELLLNSQVTISSFGIDPNNEIYVCSHGEGKIYKLFAEPPPPVALLSPPDGVVNRPNIVSCSWTSSGNASHYHLQVAIDSAFSSLVADDSTITDTMQNVGPLADSTKYFWKVQAMNSGGTSSFSTVFTFTTARHSVQMMKSWNLISLPFDVADGRVNVLFPSAISSAFDYNPIAGYKMKDTLFPDIGYWIKFPDSVSVVINGAPRYDDTLAIVAGWNMIGSIAAPIPVDAIIQQPKGLLVSNFFEYDGSYQAVTTLQPGRGYWVKAGGLGNIILQGTPFNPPAPPSSFKH